MEDVISRKLVWRIVPILTLGYFLAYIDRVNSGFAALQMNQDIGLSSSQYGLGAGIFFVSYVLFEIPSNLLQNRLGARIWIARIMISWGLISGLMAFVVGPISFYAVRFGLGAAEAGFFPGVVLYLTQFFPSRQRAQIMSWFAIAIPISSLVGSPISAGLLALDGFAGLRGWQSMYILEAIPSILLGIVILIILPDTPRQARWLSSAEREWLELKLASEQKAARVIHAPIWKIMLNPYVLVLALALGGSAGVSQALALWQPQIIKSFGLSNMTVGLLNGIPFGIASIAMVLWGRRSDAKAERVWHTVLPLALSAIVLGGATFVHELVPFIAVLCLVLIGTYSMKGPFWGLSSEWLAGSAAVVGLAQVNSLGNVATFLTSTAIGVIHDRTQSFGLALLPLVIVAALGCVGLLVVVRRDAGKRKAAMPLGGKL